MTRIAAATLPAPALPDSADEGWDMSARREGQVMAEIPRAAEPADAMRPLPPSRGLLSPAEIEALLRPDLSDLPPEPEPVVAAPSRRIEEFEGTRASPAAHDSELARRHAARLSLALRASSGLAVAATVAVTGRAPFDAAVRQSGDARGLAIACFATRSGDIGAMLILSPGLAQMMIETACGARVRSGAIKPLSPIDVAVLSALLRPLGPVISPELSFSSLETEAAFAASIAPPSEALTAELSMRVQTESFGAHLLLAGPLVSPVLPETVRPAAAGASSAYGALSVTLTARIASLAVPLSKLSGLKPGATLLLGVPPDEPVALVSGGEGGAVAAEAEIGRRGGRVALRITRRGPALASLIRT